MRDELSPYAILCPVVIANTAARSLRQDQLIVRRAANLKAMFLSSVLSVL